MLPAVLDEVIHSSCAVGAKPASGGAEMFLAIDVLQDVKASSSSSSIKEGAVLYTWVQHRMVHFLAALQNHLPGIEEGTNLASVLENCMHCCSSLSRVGLDFSSLLEPLFQLCVLRLFSAKLAVAVEAFQQRLENHKWVAIPAPMFSKPKPDGAADNSGAGTAASGEAEGAPPYMLMEHVPLAVFTNGVLSALNELRHCALLPLLRPTAALLQGALEQVASSMVHYKHTRSLADSEVVLFQAAARALPEVLVSFLASCLGRIMPGSGQLLRASAVASILQESAS